MLKISAILISVLLCLAAFFDLFLDDEYGYAYKTGGRIKLGDVIPPFNFTVTRIIDLGEGWCFFYTT